MSWLVVTPARNEAHRLPALARSLAAQAPGLIGQWVVVDDGSSDGTRDCLPADLPFPALVVARTNDGGLARGSAFGAWRFGAEHGLTLLPTATRVLKVDADVLLDEDCFAHLDAEAAEAGIAGALLRGEGEVLRHDYTRGPVKSYSRQAYDVVRQLPTAVGFDVVDEVAVRRAGMIVQLVHSAGATVTRETGSSEGLLRGRYRGGVVARWAGYHPLYVTLRLLRYLWRRPYVVGAVATAWGGATAGPGPYPAELRRALHVEQSARLRQLVRHPRAGARLYGVRP
jgi:dolichol-phosphate mannosyltransferase